MSLLNKILIFLGVALLLCGIGLLIFKLNEISNKQLAIESSLVAQKELADNIMRSQSQYANKNDIANLIKENNVNLKAIQDDLSKLHAEISSVNIVTAHSKGQSGNNLPSTGTGNSNPNPISPSNPDPYGYLKKEQVLTLNENFSNVQLPIGKVGFSAWQEKPWSINISPREYKVINVIGTDENQRNYVYNKFIVKIDNKDFDIKISTAETKQEFPEAKFSFWNPRLFLTAGGSVNLTQAPIQGSANAGITLGIMSYGRFKRNPDVQVLQLGIAYQSGTNRISVIVNPVNFNIGRLAGLEIINNTYIGPSLQVDTMGNVFTGANISLGF